MHYGKLEGLDRHYLVEANFKRFWSHFKGFLGVNWTQRLLEACLPPSYIRRRPLEPLKLLTTLLKDLAGDVGLDFGLDFCLVFGFKLHPENP